MKFYSSKLDSFLQGLERNKTLGALVYGPNSGGITDAFNKVAQSIVPDLSDPFLVVNIDQNSLKDNETIIYDEATSIPFMGGKKLVIIRGAEGKDITSRVVSALESLPEDNFENCFILITATELTPASPLRKIFEKQKNLAAIACYEEDERSIEAKIKGYIFKNGIKADYNTIKLISENLNGDTKVIDSFLERLNLYLGDNKNLDIEIVSQLIGNSSDTKVQEIIDYFIEGKNADLEFKIRQMKEEGISEIVVIRSLQRYLEKVHYCVEQMQNGNNLDSAVSALRPPIFFKQATKFKTQVMKFRQVPQKLPALFAMLTHAEAALKESGADGYLILSRSLNFAFKRK